jgi:8-oxo-dGTP pyrophosphatase MutT (NUDIX family)
VDEKIDVLDARGLMTGEVAWKSEAHRLGLWHRCFHCWIVAPETSFGGPYLFVQRRAVGKETWPDRLDVTVGGHLGAGEEALEGGLREIGEELGLQVVPEDFIPLGTRRIELEIPVGIDREFQEVFLLVRSPLPRRSAASKRRGRRRGAPPARRRRGAVRGERSLRRRVDG